MYQVVDDNTQFLGYYPSLMLACKFARETAELRIEPMYVFDDSNSEVACFDGGSGQLGYTYDPTA